MKYLFSFYIFTFLVLSVFLSSCGGGGGSDAPPKNTNTPGVAPTAVWSVDTAAKNPVTDLAACAESVMTCVKGGTVLRNCFVTEVTICTSAEPGGGCCMQACKDQLVQKLDSGSSEQDAFLEVFVYDGSCMPGIVSGVNP